MAGLPDPYIVGSRRFELSDEPGQRQAIQVVVNQANCLIGIHERTTEDY